MLETQIVRTLLIPVVLLIAGCANTAATVMNVSLPPAPRYAEPVVFEIVSPPTNAVLIAKGRRASGQFDLKDLKAFRDSLEQSAGAYFAQSRVLLTATSRTSGPEKPVVRMTLVNHLISNPDRGIAEFDVRIQRKNPGSQEKNPASEIDRFTVAVSGSDVSRVKDFLNEAAIYRILIFANTILRGQEFHPPSEHITARYFLRPIEAISILPVNQSDFECAFYENSPYGMRCVAYREVKSPAHWESYIQEE
ncbi:MAG: hypothetical protein K8S54_10530 [Spirochaetia bacterium]|nr:hypothetical protein [Spirochaetia bacterium]